MTASRTIDTHTHILTQETAGLLTRAGVKVTITPDDEDNAAFDVAGTVYRPFPTGGFDIARRLKDMDAAGVDVHVLSATPQTYLYNQGDELSATLAAIQNDQMATHLSLIHILFLRADGDHRHSRRLQDHDRGAIRADCAHCPVQDLR